jgi:YfiH family protein
MNYHIHYGFSDRSAGDMRHTETVTTFLASRGLDSKDLVTAQQIHGTEVIWVDDNHRGLKIPLVDALMYQPASNAQPLILGILTADCVPLLVYDEEHGTIAAIHSGWKGTLAKIVQKTIAALIARGSQPAHLFCVIGPHIRSCCYSVPEERAQRFIEAFGQTSVIYQSPHHLLDLSFAVRSQILSFKIDHSHIIDQGLCTASNVQQFYSYRKDTKDTFGEMLGFITVSQ